MCAICLIKSFECLMNSLTCFKGNFVGDWRIFDCFVVASEMVNFVVLSGFIKLIKC